MTRPNLGRLVDVAEFSIDLGFTCVKEIVSLADMTGTGVGSAPPDRISASDAVAARVKQLRRQRGWSATKLAERCAQAGAPQLTASVLANIETGRPDPHGARRRDITVDELLVLAYVLNVAPTHLISTPNHNDTAVLVTPTTPITDPHLLTRWIRGDQPLPDTDTRAYHAAATQHTPNPDDEHTITDHARDILQDRAKQIVSQFRAETDRLAAHTRDQLSELVAEAERSLTHGATTNDILTLLRAAQHTAEPTPKP